MLLVLVARRILLSGFINTSNQKEQCHECDKTVENLPVQPVLVSGGNISSHAAYHQSFPSLISVTEQTSQQMCLDNVHQ